MVGVAVATFHDNGPLEGFACLLCALVGFVAFTMLNNYVARH